MCCVKTEYNTYMNWKRTLKREGYVALRAQTLRFRLIKYSVLIVIWVITYELGGWNAIGIVFLTLLVLALCVHFFYRYKTNVWTKSWGGYKKLDLPE